jgi:hypothetical protein
MSIAFGWNLIKMFEFFLGIWLIKLSFKMFLFAIVLASSSDSLLSKENAKWPFFLSFFEAIVRIELDFTEETLDLIGF